MEEDEETWFEQGDEENGDDNNLPKEDSFLDSDDQEFKTRKSFIATSKTNKLSTEQPVVNSKTVNIVWSGCILTG